MKKILKSASVLAVAAVFGFAAQAHADTTPGWYAGLGAGATFTPDSSTSAGGNTDATFNTGWNANVNGGYAWTNGLRAEAELFHSTAVVDKTHTPGTQNSGQLSNTGLFLNGLYDFNMNSMFTPYVGVGVGFSNVVATNIGSTVNHTALDDNDLELAYQAIGGVAAQINPKWAITADYRYVATLQPTFDTRASGHGTMENASHNVVLGVRYSFGAPAAPMVERPMATPVVHAAPAKNVAAKVAQSYEVFFDFNKATLTPEAKNILASAAADYRAGKYVKVVVTGHTDTVGSAKVNKALSERRAASVKSELAAQGVPPTAVAMRGVGKNDLLVPTADGVREAQNRRAEIVFENK